MFTLGLIIGIFVGTNVGVLLAGVLMSNRSCGHEEQIELENERMTMFSS